MGLLRVLGTSRGFGSRTSTRIGDIVSVLRVQGRPGFVHCRVGVANTSFPTRDDLGHRVGRWTMGQQGRTTSTWVVFSGRLFATFFTRGVSW